MQNNPLSRNDPTGHDWFYVDKMWQWQKGHVYHDHDGNATKDKGYEYLLVFQKTGTNKFGAATGTLTLYDQNKVAAQSNVFSGGTTPDAGMKVPIPNGNYMINLANRGSFTAGYNYTEMSHFNGLQTIHDGSGIDKSGNPWTNSATWEWGDIRASLNHPNNGNSDFQGNFLHGKVRPDDYTHGCICERSEVILHMLQGMTVQSVPVEVK